MTKWRWVYFVAGVLVGELIGALVRNPLPPVPGWPFRVSLFIAMTGVAVLIITGAKLGERAGDFVFALFAGSYLGYVF